MTLAHVVEPAFKVGEAILVPAVDQDPQAHAHMETEARGYVARIAAGTRATGLEVNEQVVSGEAVHSLLDLARELSVDLIALATHGRTGWQRLAFGSVADKIVRTSDIPMLVLRPHAETA
jgi:nucleotide-binding universal stress UspA family protein